MQIIPVGRAARNRRGEMGGATIARDCVSHVCFFFFTRPQAKGIVGLFPPCMPGWH